MGEPNYNETVVIPLLQRKFKNLVDENLILEANLLVERERNAFLSARLLEMQTKLDSANKKKKKEDHQVDGQTF